MAEAVRLGRMTDTMEEGFIAELNVKVGDKVKTGDSIAEIETDKATLPLESYYAGTVLHIAVKKGDTLKIGDLIAIIGKEGEDFSALLNAPSEKAPEKPAEKAVDKSAKKEADRPVEKEEEKKTEPAKISKEQAPTTDEKPAETETEVAETPAMTDSRVKASPLARQIAKEKGLDLGRVKGSGEDGRIVKRDLENAGKGKVVPVPAFEEEENYKDLHVSQMRRAIAKRLSESKSSSPHFYLTIDVNMNNAVALRSQLNDVLPAKISYNDIVIKSVAMALRQYPNVNCSWLGDTIRYYDHIHIGMAVAVEEGLLVPVIRFADGKTVQQISEEAKALAEKALSKKLLPPEMEGNTFTISNLGMFGIEEFTAIINPPDSCILAVGAIRQEPAVIANEIKIVHKMKMTMSCDHRSVDGATGAKFLQVLKKVLEEPVRVLL